MFNTPQDLNPKDVDSVLNLNKVFDVKFVETFFCILFVVNDIITLEQIDGFVRGRRKPWYIRCKLSKGTILHRYIPIPRKCRGAVGYIRGVPKSHRNR